MSRLTYKSESGMTWFVDEEGRRLEPCEMSPHHSRLAIEKLAHYEDLEEAGRLIELPCKVGSNVYAIGMNGEIIAFTVDTIGYALSIASQIGKGFYLTKAEAEAKLEELKGGAE